MLAFIARRLASMIVTFSLATIIIFAVIQFPPGDYVDNYIVQLTMSGGADFDMAELAAKLREFYGLDKPYFIQYLVWVTNMVQGDFGYSFVWKKPVSKIIGGQLGWTILLGIGIFTFAWIIGIPVGIYSATHQYSLGDYVFTTAGFLGLAIPNFFLATVLVSFVIFFTNSSITGGLFSPQYVSASWSLSRVIDLLTVICS